jgi:hypothetical protein
MDPAAIRTALQTALANVSGLTAYTYWPDACQTLPAAMPVPGPGVYGETFDDQGSIVFEIHLLAAWAEGGFETGQQLLDAFLVDTGSTSVRAALEADCTLGGVVQDLRVRGWRDYHFSHRMFPAGPPAWGVVFPVEIWAE